MAKGERIEAELELPKEIIQHIQCFLNGKEAAQTTLLSKSWYAAWLNRPDLHFDQDDFENTSYTPHSSETGFWEHITETMERYETLNLKIDSLRLCIHGVNFANSFYNSIVKELILKALKLGATSLDFKMISRFTELTLPLEVFGSKNLVKLSLSGCGIGTGEDGKVRCSRLKSLTLERVIVKSNIFWDIISSCPLIENLSLSTYKCYSMALSPFTEFGKRNVGLFNRLKSLLLSWIDVDALFFHDFSTKFPCLKDLSLHGCDGYNAIEVSSPSLECISFIRKKKILRAKLDVPSIRKFTFSGTIPSLSFKTTSTDWRSHISIKLYNSPNAEWILEMNKLLTELSQSKVSLCFSLCRGYIRTILYCPEDIKGLRKPEVENLMFSGYDFQNSSELLDALFWCCRPTYVTQDLFQFDNCDFMEIVYKRVMQHVDLKCNSASQSERVCDLEEVDVEFFDRTVCEWRPRLLDGSTCPGADQQRIRLHLKWRS